MTEAGVMHEAGCVCFVHLDIVRPSISLFGKSSWLFHVDF